MGYCGPRETNEMEKLPRFSLHPWILHSSSGSQRTLVSIISDACKNTSPTGMIPSAARG